MSSISAAAVSSRNPPLRARGRCTYTIPMARKRMSTKRPGRKATAGKAVVARVARAKGDGGALPVAPQAGRPSALIDTRVICCDDCLPEACVDLLCIDPPFNPGPATRREATPRGPRPRRVSGVNSNRNHEVFWGGTKEKRAFEDRHASAQSCTGNAEDRP